MASTGNIASNTTWITLVKQNAASAYAMQNTAAQQQQEDGHTLALPNTWKIVTLRSKPYIIGTGDKKKHKNLKYDLRIDEALNIR